MDKDVPKVGWIVEHYFLWADEKTGGQIEGRKPRPCIIIAVENQAQGQPRVTVLPITSSPPAPGVEAVAIPNPLKQSICLEADRPSWIVVDDANVFTWPGYDLVRQPHGSFMRGMVTAGFFTQLREVILSVHGTGKPKLIERDH